MHVCADCEAKAKELAAKKLKSFMETPMQEHFQNVSAHIRSLIYKDLGLMEEYEREVQQMGRIEE